MLFSHPPFSLRTMLCFSDCGSANPYLSAGLFISFHRPGLSQVERRAVYGVVIVSYPMPYLIQSCIPSQ